MAVTQGQYSALRTNVPIAQFSLRGLPVEVTIRIVQKLDRNALVSLHRVCVGSFRMLETEVLDMQFTHRTMKFSLGGRPVSDYAAILQDLLRRKNILPKPDFERHFRSLVRDLPYMRESPGEEPVAQSFLQLQEGDSWQCVSRMMYLQSFKDCRTEHVRAPLEAVLASLPAPLASFLQSIWKLDTLRLSAHRGWQNPMEGKLAWHELLDITASLAPPERSRLLQESMPWLKSCLYEPAFWNAELVKRFLGQASPEHRGQMAVELCKTFTECVRRHAYREVVNPMPLQMFDLLMEIAADIDTTSEAPFMAAIAQFLVKTYAQWQIPPDACCKQFVEHCLACGHNSRPDLMQDVTSVLHISPASWHALEDAQLSHIARTLAPGLFATPCQGRHATDEVFNVFSHALMRNEDKPDPLLPRLWAWVDQLTAVPQLDFLQRLLKLRPGSLAMHRDFLQQVLERAGKQQPQLSQSFAKAVMENACSSLPGELRRQLLSWVIDLLAPHFTQDFLLQAILDEIGPIDTFMVHFFNTKLFLDLLPLAKALMSASGTMPGHAIKQSIAVSLLHDVADLALKEIRLDTGPIVAEALELLPDVPVQQLERVLIKWSEVLYKFEHQLRWEAWIELCQRLSPQQQVQVYTKVCAYAFSNLTLKEFFMRTRQNFGEELLLKILQAGASGLGGRGKLAIAIALELAKPGYPQALRLALLKAAADLPSDEATALQAQCAHWPKA